MMRICIYEMEIPSMSAAGMVKIMPAARSPPELPAVCIMLTSCLLVFPSDRRKNSETREVVTIGQYTPPTFRPANAL